MKSLVHLLLSNVWHSMRATCVPLLSLRRLTHANAPMRILVAEDIAINQLIAVRMLERLGYHVALASNGHEVLQKLAVERFDLILMDCQMPLMDGYEASQAIRASSSTEWSKIPIIAFTANAHPGDREYCLKCGMNDYVTKPVGSEDLARVLDRWVRPKKPRSLRPHAS